MKIRKAFIGAMLLPLALVGCSSTNSGPTTAAGTTSAASATNAAATCKGATVAYITPGLSIPYWRSVGIGVEQAATKDGAKVTNYDSKLSASTQLQNAQDAITAGVKAIIISPTDSSSAPAVLDLAAKANVPVVIADVGTDSGTYVSFIKTDNIAAAKAAGEYLVAELKKAGITKGNIGMITISQARQNGKDRTKGFDDAVQAAGFTVLEPLESQDYTRAEGLKLAQDLLTSHPDMVAIFTQHDEATMGASTAVDTVGSKVMIVGFDGSPDSLAAIEAGKVAGAAMQQPVTMGNDAMTAVCAHLSGETVKDVTYVPVTLVTKENVAGIKASLTGTVFSAN